MKLQHVFHHAHDTFKEFSINSIITDEYSTQSALLLPFDVPYKTETRMPDPTNARTVLTLGLMTLNSYFEPDTDKWVDIPGWNATARFGWENDGIRGYVFADDERKTVIISFKGTSPRWISGGPSSVRDKLNDNLMFSCCCGEVDRTWKPFCACKDEALSNTCSKDCLVENTNIADSYYNLAQTIYLAVRQMYPLSTSVWMTGHSLGGALASLVALTNGIPAFTYEAPGDMMFAARVGLLPVIPTKNNTRPDFREFMKSLPIYHFGNDGDPIFLGKCNGITSSCYWGGYALESKCHVGKQCLYKLEDIPKNIDDDISIEKFDIRHHGIQFLVDNVLTRVINVPACVVEEDCSECDQWMFT